MMSSAIIRAELEQTIESFNRSVEPLLYCNPENKAEHNRLVAIVRQATNALMDCDFMKDVRGAIKRLPKFKLLEESAEPESALQGLYGLNLWLVQLLHEDYNHLSIHRQKLEEALNVPIEFDGLLFSRLKTRFVLWVEKVRSSGIKVEQVKAGYHRCLEADHLQERNILLRYGDYVGKVCSSYKNSRPGQPGPPPWKRHMNSLNKKLWTTINDELTAEARQRNTKIEVRVASGWDLEIVQRLTPYGSYTSRLRKLAADLHVPPEEMMWNIRTYSKRCKEAHALLDELIEDEQWEQMAIQIMHDTTHWQKLKDNRSVPKEEADGWLKAIRFFQDQYFQKLEWAKNTNNCWAVTVYQHHGDEEQRGSGFEG